jgi:deoxyribonuclease V
MSKSGIPPGLINEYRERQSEMARQVIETPLAKEPRIVAAIDMHVADELALGSAVALAYPELALVDENVATQTVTFPYIPGLLSFREAPVCLAAVAGLEAQPDLVLVDGQGRAHPRRFGIACHVGYELGIPTIGVAKSILVGRHGELGEERGSTAPLIDRGEVVGMAVRTRPGTKPVYVSVGNLITLEDAVEWVLRTTGRYRLPEPSRQAHKLAQTRATELRSGKGKA